MEELPNMVYEYTYRKADGSPATDYVEAKDRSEAVAVISARGHRAISLRESKGRPVENAERDRLKCRPSWLRGAVAGGAVVAAASCAWLILRPISQPPSPVVHETPPKPHAAEPVRDVVDRAPVPAVQTNADVAVTAPVPSKPAPETNAVGGSRSPWADKPRRVIKPRPPEKKRLFKHNSENVIADILEIEPGDSLIGELPFDRRFVEDFRKSLSEKIEILPTDSEYERKMKQAVIDTKAELKARMDAGEDIGKIMRDTRAELQETGIYRDQLIQELHEIRRSGEWTADEYEKFVTAANAMLASKGAKPITTPKVLIRKLKLKDEKRKAAGK